MSEISRPGLCPADLLATLADNADAADAEALWPGPSWESLRRAGVLGWCIPTRYGGTGLGAVELLTGYEELAAACLTTCFLLSQREAACRRIRDSGREDLCRELLPPLARGERFATVGLSQLTTSGQHRRPSLRVRPSAAGVVLDGFVPWVTGAERADSLVIGGVLEDGRQVLAVTPRELPGISVGAALPLTALRGSVTAEVRCDRVELDRRWLLAGPSERVLTAGRGGAGGLETSCLALGLAGAALRYLADEARARPELRAPSERLEGHRQQLRRQMHRLAENGGPPDEMTTLRAGANQLVLRATQVALAAAKGAGFVRPHPAQRWARQALFFLVWSCPRPALEATLAHLAGPLETTDS